MASLRTHKLEGQLHAQYHFLQTEVVCLWLRMENPFFFHLQVLRILMIALHFHHVSQQDMAQN